MGKWRNKMQLIHKLHCNFAIKGIKRNGAASVEDSMAIPQNFNRKLTFNPSVLHQSIESKDWNR